MPWRGSQRGRRMWWEERPGDPAKNEFRGQVRGIRKWGAKGAGVTLAGANKRRQSHTHQTSHIVQLTSSLTLFRFLTTGFPGLLSHTLS